MSGYQMSFVTMFLHSFILGFISKLDLRFVSRPTVIPAQAQLLQNLSEQLGVVVKSSIQELKEEMRLQSVEAPEWFSINRPPSNSKTEAWFADENKTSELEAGPVSPETWLQTHKFEFKSARQADTSDAIFDQLAVTLGNNIALFTRFLNVIRPNLIFPRKFWFSLDLYNQPDADIIKDFCRTLHHYAFLQTLWINPSGYSMQDRSKISPANHLFDRRLVGTLCRL